VVAGAAARRRAALDWPRPSRRAGPPLRATDARAVTEETGDPLANARLTGYTRPGFAAAYHAHRPRPPAALVPLLLRLAGRSRAALVVDLGAGTGLSTVLWAEHADRVIGVEPLDEMRGVAATQAAAATVAYRPGVAQATGLPAGAADIVTCAQSLHDMEPGGTLAEVSRLLRGGGVFAAYDYDWPPVVDPEAEEAFLAFVGRVRALRERHGITSAMRQWDKAGHLDRLRASGRFRYVRELLLHHVEPCSAERWVGFALTLGPVIPLLDLGLDDDDLGLPPLREAARRAFGGGARPWHVSYRVAVGLT